MSQLFRRPKIVMAAPTPAPEAPAPRDTEDAMATERMRRAMALRGRTSTRTTQGSMPAAPGGPVQTLLGGG